MEFAGMAHLQAKLEPGVGERKERADVLLFFSSCISLVDVTVIDGQCPSHMGKAAKPLGAAAYKEREKLNKYEQQARSEGKKFFPLVFETTGGIGLAVRSSCGCLVTRLRQRWRRLLLVSFLSPSSRVLSLAKSSCVGRTWFSRGVGWRGG